MAANANNNNNNNQQQQQVQFATQSTDQRFAVEAHHGHTDR
jgi:hypothetical protein